jgi:MFS transporter, OFA family, oxalate/formate antiporter
LPVMGFMSGMYGILSAVTWPRFFGVKHLGAISGYAMSWMVIGSAVGPFIFSVSYRMTGHYDLAIMDMYCVVVVASDYPGTSGQTMLTAVKADMNKE